MTPMATKPSLKRKNPADLTLRNLRALRKDLAVTMARVDALAAIVHEVCQRTPEAEPEPSAPEPLKPTLEELS